MKTTIRAAVAAFALTFAVSTAVPLALAAGSNSGGGSSPGGGNSGSGTSPKKLHCKRGEVVKLVTVNGKKIKKCVKKSAGLLPDDELYEQGVALAKEGEYDWALDVFALIQNQNDPKVLNYMGYSNRKAGRLETGIEFYNRALTIDPNFVLAREYLGEGYAAAGRVDLAQIQLEEIAKRCGTSCEEYLALSKVIGTAAN